MSRNTFSEEASPQLSYKELTPLEKRLNFRTKTQKKNPDALAVIVEKHASNKTLPELSNNRFTVLKTIKVGQIRAQICNKLKCIDGRLNLNSSFYIICQNRILSSEMSFAEIHDKFADQEDGIIYLKYGQMETM